MHTPVGRLWVTLKPILPGILRKERQHMANNLTMEPRAIQASVAPPQSSCSGVPRTDTQKLWVPEPKDFERIASWGLDKNPFAAVDDYSDLKAQLRWLNPEHRECHNAYFLKRLEYMEFTKNYEHYYKTASKPIDRLRWEYLMARKAWYIMPLGWENFTAGGRLVDVGCGDGDAIQRVIRFVERNWKENKVTGRSLHIVGFDLNPSRLENARKLVQATNPNITFEFRNGNLVSGTDFPDQYFDYAICTGVIEIVDDGTPLTRFMNELCRFTKKGFYSEELVEKYPGGVPPVNLPEMLAERRFRVKKKHLVFTEPFDLYKVQDPMKIWPILVDMNLYAERF
jgi:ubiquinone/menaquinone biosynthesis C-methylase UbiE